MKFRLVQQISYSVTCLLLLAGIGIASQIVADGTTSVTPSWAAPNTMALKLVRPAPTVPNQPIAQSNLDCTTISYRDIGSSSMQTGCFTDTAFGFMKDDDDRVIFNGTDEAIRLQMWLPHQTLVPWPNAAAVLTLNAVDPSGSRLGLYRNLTASLGDQRNALGTLTGKQLTSTADLWLQDPSGQPLDVNPQTIAFSANGTWLVAENMEGSFVRINLSDLTMLPFAKSFTAAGSPAMIQSRVAVSPSGQFVAIQNDSSPSLTVYDLSTCSDPSAGLKPLSCQSHNYQPFVAGQVTGFKSINHLRFINDELLSFDALTTSQTTTYELAPTASINSLIDYLGMGDSYTSGEGAFDYLTGTDTTNNLCHLSVKSYPLLLSRDLFGNAGGHSVACSGAVINDVGSTKDSYSGQARGLSYDSLTHDPTQLNEIISNFLPGYLSQRRFVDHYQPAIATVSVGGDDIGFGDILQNCVELHVSLHPSTQTCYNTYEDRVELTNLIDRTIPRLSALYQQLQAAAPSMQLYVVGYPQIADDTGNCGANVHLNQSELEFAAELINYLNGAIAQATQKAGATYVDISQALVGHRLCEARGYDVAVNGLTAGSDGGIGPFKVLGRESYHPNALGQSLIEQEILQQTHNLQARAPTGVPESDGNLLNAPKIGRQINTLVPDDDLAPSSTTAGSSLPITLNGSADGVAGHTTFTVHLDGPTGQSIGTLTSDMTGNITSSVTMPDSTSVGGHRLDVIGQNQAGEPIDITQPIYVIANTTDNDGDGQSNITDSCYNAMNSDQDIDQDGIDDSCDPIIGSAPIIPPPDKNQAESTAPPSNTTNAGQPTITNPQPAGDSLLTSEHKGTQSLIVSTTLATPQRITRVLGATTPSHAVKMTSKSFGTPNSLSPSRLRSSWWQWVVIPLLLLICWGLWRCWQIIHHRRRTTYQNARFPLQ
ncbi:MAG TPA: SGNH/GDSL hydrolase family protein [Candidatus Saccharimonadales bacterium]|nr:SGNH/GDSL hydrolase family protein [Candidatus Saccharimonadales bacterium]